MIHKFRFVPLLLAIAIFIIGIYYSVFKAGIPYQDPTPEMTEKYMSYMKLGDSFMLTGAMLLVASVILLIVLKILRSKKQPEL